jgi:hypothetical protein
MGPGRNLAEFHQMANVSWLNVEYLGRLAESHLVSGSDSPAPVHQVIVGEPTSVIHRNIGHNSHCLPKRNSGCTPLPAAISTYRH